MAKTATIYTTYKMTGDGETDNYAGTTFTNTNSPGQSGYVNLSSGDNTLTPPPVTAKGLLIIPPAANVATITLKGNAADIGIALAPGDETKLRFPDAGPGTIILNAGSAIQGVRLIWF